MTTFQRAAVIHLPVRPRRAAFESGPDGILGTLHLWLTRHRRRRELERLDAALLEDIGLTPMDARREAAKPFWKA